LELWQDHDCKAEIREVGKLDTSTIITKKRTKNVLQQLERITEYEISKLLYQYKQRKTMPGKSGKNME
jgi:hypothetical protein